MIPENTHHSGKYHSTTDLLFDWFGFDQTRKTTFYIIKAGKSTQNKQEVIQTVILKLMFSWVCDKSKDRNWQIDCNKGEIGQYIERSANRLIFRLIDKDIDCSIDFGLVTNQFHNKFRKSTFYTFCNPVLWWNDKSHTGRFK